MRLRGERDLLSGPVRPAGPARGAALVLAGAALWGTAGASQALLGGTFTPQSVGALRIAVGGLALGLLAAAARRRAAPTSGSAPGTSTRRRLLAVATVGVVGYQLGFFVGVDALGIAVGTLLAVGSAPFFAGIVTVITGSGRPTGRWMLTTVAAVAGLALLVRPEGDVRVDAAGVTAALIAGLSFGTYTVVSKRLLAAGLRHVDVVAVPFVLGALTVLPLLAAAPTVRDPATWADPRTLAVILWLGLGATAAGYVLFLAGLRVVPAVVGATLALMEPLTATLLGVGVFGERLGAAAAAGALVVAGALLATAVPGRAARAGGTPTDAEPAG